MRTHTQIVKDGGVSAIAERRRVSIHTVRSWLQRNSIPAEHWSGLVDDGLSSLEELAAAVARPVQDEAA